MITGLNTDVRFGDTTYHVQTEDKGESNPLIESLVYIGGQILESFRTSYHDFLKSVEFAEPTLQKILESQHRQLVNAIRRGLLRKGMGLQDYVEGEFVFRFNSCRVSTAHTPKGLSTQASSLQDKRLAVPALEPVVGKGSPAPKTKSKPVEAVIKDSEPIRPTRGQESTGKSRGEIPPLALDAANFSFEGQQGIEIHVEGSKVFVAGSHVDLSLSVQSCGLGTKLENVQVVIKVIGTAFSPRLYAGKTDKHGDLKISFNLPNYTMGSAALIIQAHTSLGADEVKYLIKKK
jgi:hypothetical protein